MTTQPPIFDGDQAVLFDGDLYWREPTPETEPEPEIEPEPEMTAQQVMGYDNDHRGKIAQAAFEWRMAELGAATSRASSDPCGGIRSDTIVAFDRRLMTIQVKSARIDQWNGAEFDLGPRNGSRTSIHDGRRRLGVFTRADFFALAVFNEGTAITDWYLIPADRLQRRRTLKVTPGRWSLRKRKGNLEPEKFRIRDDNWERLLDAKTVPRDSRAALDRPMGQS